MVPGTITHVVTQLASEIPAVPKSQAMTACHRVLAFGGIDDLNDAEAHLNICDSIFMAVKGKIHPHIIMNGVRKPLP